MKSSEFIEKYIRPVVNVMVPPEVQREGELLNATEQIIALGPILELQKIFPYMPLILQHAPSPPCFPGTNGHLSPEFPDVCLSRIFLE